MTKRDNRDPAEPTGEPPKRKPREGWAEAFQEIADAGDDALVWPEFPNADDSDLSW
jgi:antitoxin MazE